VCWHPTQHVIAVGCYGGEFPVLMYSADRDPSKAAATAVVEEVGEVDNEKENAKSKEEGEKNRALLEEKRKANRERYLELKANALQRRTEGQ
jgi:hypothetical protein